MLRLHPGACLYLSSDHSCFPADLAFFILLALAVLVFPFLFSFVVFFFVLFFPFLVLVKLKRVGMLALSRPILKIQYAKIGVVKTQSRFKLAKTVYLCVEQDMFLGLHTQVPKQNQTAICLGKSWIGEPCNEFLELGKLNLDTPKDF